MEDVAFCCSLLSTALLFTGRVTRVTRVTRVIKLKRVLAVRWMPRRSYNDLTTVFTMISAMTFTIISMITTIPLIFLLFFPQGGAASLINCGSAFDIRHLVADPSSIVAANQSVSFHSAFYVPESILNGTVHSYVSMNYVNVFESTEDLCTRTIACPLEMGHRSIHRTFIFPPELWGRIQMTFYLHDQFKRQFMCLQYNVYATGTKENKTGFLW